MTTRFEKLEEDIDARFDKVDERFEKLEEDIDARFDKVNDRFEKFHELLRELTVSLAKTNTEVEWIKRIGLGIGGSILIYIVKQIFFGS